MKMSRSQRQQIELITLALPLAKLKISKRKHLNMANCYGGNRIQNITQTLELFDAAEENYRDDADLLRVLFKIHQGTEQVPRNTVTVTYTMHITIRNSGIASGLRFFSTRGSRKNKIPHLGQWT